MRYPTRVTPWILPVFLLLGLTRSRCFTEVSATGVRVKLGWLFDRQFDRSTIQGTASVGIPWYCGPGVHMDLRGRTFVTGAWGLGVEIQFAAPQATGWLYGGKCKRLVVTPQDAEALIEALAANVAV